MDKLYIVIPAYNEATNIEAVLQGWYSILKKFGGSESKLVVIDDGSKDNTYEIMKRFEHKYEDFIPLTKANGGHGDTILYGYQYALDHKADYIFQTDSDGQTLPTEFENFWQQRERFDMIIGHRKNREDGFSRVMVTKALKFVVKICFGVTITDANTPFRLMKASTLNLCIPKIPDHFNLSNVLLVILAEKSRKNIKYIPISFRQRQGGVNSINIKNMFKIGLNAIKDFNQIKKSI